MHNLTTLLGAQLWKAALIPGVSHPDTVILTRHKARIESDLLGNPAYFDSVQFVKHRSLIAYHAPDPESNLYGIGASIDLSADQQRRVINFFSMHLDFTSYGPYAANNKKVTRKEQIMAGERNQGGWGKRVRVEEGMG